MCCFAIVLHVTGMTRNPRQQGQVRRMADALHHRNLVPHMVGVPCSRSRWLQNRASLSWSLPSLRGVVFSLRISVLLPLP